MTFQSGKLRWLTGASRNECQGELELTFSLASRFSYNTFDDESRATIGVDFEIANFSVMGVNFNLQV